MTGGVLFGLLRNGGVHVILDIYVRIVRWVCGGMMYDSDVLRCDCCFCPYFVCVAVVGESEGSIGYPRGGGEVRCKDGYGIDSRDWAGRDDGWEII